MTPENEYWPDKELKYKPDFWDKLFPKGIADYGASYTLTHPWVILKYCQRQIKYAWQRVFRGWDDRVIWSIGIYLATNIPVWINELKRKHQGIPMSFFDENDWDHESGKMKDGGEERANIRYNLALDQIAKGFESYLEMLEPHNKEELSILEIDYKLGFSYLQKYFKDLFD